MAKYPDFDSSEKTVKQTKHTDSYYIFALNSSNDYLFFYMVY